MQLSKRPGVGGGGMHAYISYKSLFIILCIISKEVLDDMEVQVWEMAKPVPNAALAPRDGLYSGQ